MIVRMSMNSPQCGILTLILKSLGISLTFGILVWALRAATPMAAFFGSLICFLVILGTGYANLSPFRSGLTPLGTLFVLTFASTNAGKRRKVKLGVAEEKRGRNAAQIVANLGMAGLVIAGGFFSIFDVLCCRGVSGEYGFSVYAAPVALLAALCEATADTVSSEIGQAFAGTPVMLTTFRRVETGTDGAVTILGTIAGILGAAIVAGVGMWSMRMTGRAAMFGFAGGAAGLFFDSVLGASVERKGWLGNDLVNFSSTVFAVVVALGVAVVF
jgi:uncharacterized protein (TIGR00297 family)